MRPPTSTHRPDWIKDRSDDPPGAIHGLYMNDLVGVIVTHNNGLCGRIEYLWLGLHNWPVTFRVERLTDKHKIDWNVYEIDCLDYNIPRPTAEEIYEQLRRQ